MFVDDELDLAESKVLNVTFQVTKDRSTFKLTDFGLTRNAPKDVTQTRTREGSMRYMAPEVAKETSFGSRKARYSNKADVYSYGKCIWLQSLVKLISNFYIH